MLPLDLYALYNLTNYTLLRSTQESANQMFEVKSSGVVVMVVVGGGGVDGRVTSFYCCVHNIVNIRELILNLN